MLPSCRQTITKQLEKQYAVRKAELIEKLCTVDRVCTTADCWTSRRRSFLGITVHWIDNETLERKGCCLAVRQVTGRHTYDVLAKLMSAINEEFAISNKICFTVTDSGSNFVKAFKHFGVEEGSESPPASSHRGSTDESDDTDDMEYLELHDLLQSPPSTNADEDDDIIYKLPQHWRCACHSLNLVASTDVGKMTDTVKRIATQTFAKLQGLWNKQNRSSVASDKIRRALGSLLITPGETRWNSTYDSMVKIHQLLANPDTEVKFDKLCEELDIRRLHPQQKTFVKEYVDVFKPVCCGLDVLQGEMDVGLGHLIPTVSVIKGQLTDLLTQNKLSVCGPLVQLILKGIDKRFEVMLTNMDAQLAALVNPKFKMDWVTNEDHRNRLMSILKTKMQNAVSTLSSDPTQQAVNAEVTSMSETSTAGQKDFFAVLAARRRQAAAGIGSDVEEELSRYLSDTSTDIKSLNNYPIIRKLFVHLNTGLPASAAVERLFSLGGRVFSPLRSRLSSDHFEMMLFLRCAKF